MHRVLLWVTLGFTQISHACEVIDDTGQHFTLKTPAQRLITLAPDLTEMVFAVDAGNQIVGVVQGSDYPPAAKKKPIVASYNTVDPEILLALRADLILAWTEARFISPLRDLGIPIYLSHPQKLEDIPQTIERLGCLLGHEKEAVVAAKQFRDQYHLLQKKYGYKKKITVFYQVAANPLITITARSWINEAILACGGVNVFADAPGTAPEITLEAVILANPDIIIAGEKHDEWKMVWEKWPTLKAVTTNQLYSINPDNIERASPRLIKGVEELCKIMDSVRNDESISESNQLG